MANFLGEIILIAGFYPPSGFARCDGQLLAIADYDALFNLIGTTYGGDGENNFRLPDLRGRVPIHMGQGQVTNYLLGEFGGVESVPLTTSQIPAHTHLVDVGTMTATARCKNGSATTTSPVGAVPAIETPAPYTDSALVAGVTTAKAAHVIELRSRIDSARVANSLAAFAWADAITPGTTLIRALHILELRAALAQLYSHLGMTPPVYAEQQLSAGATLKGAHIAELRSATAVVAVAGTALRYRPFLDSNMHTSAIAVSGSPTAVMTGGNQPHDNMQPFLTISYCIALFGVYPSPT
jgi:microcystin-dependent protein